MSRAPQAELDQEHWCGVMQEVAVPGTGADAAAFLREAVALANDRCDGTLSCAIFIPPQARAPASLNLLSDLENSEDAPAGAPERFPVSRGAPRQPFTSQQWGPQRGIRISTISG